MAKLSTYTKDLNITGKDMLAGSNYITTVNGIDQFETNNFTLEKITEYINGQIITDPSVLSLKANGGLVYETVNNTNYLAVNLSHTNITGQLANSDLVNSYITINGSNIELGGSIDIPVGDITSVTAGTYLNGGGTTGDVTINHDLTTRTNTSASVTLAYGDTFTAYRTVLTNLEGHVTGSHLITYTLPESDDTTYTQEVIDSSNDAILRLVGSDSTNDDIKLIAGANITLNVNEGTDEITIASQAFGNVFTVNSEAAMIAATSTGGDLVVRTDVSKTFIHNGGTTGTVADFTELQFSGINTLNITASDGIDTNTTLLTQSANSLTITNSLATSSERGGIQIGYTENGKNYPVELSSEKAYVNVPWTDTTYTAGAGLDLVGTEFSHTDTSSQTSVNNSGRTYIQDITLDTYGHVTGLTSATETVVDTNDYVDSIAITGSGTKTITLGRTGALSDLTATFTDNDTTYTTATSSVLGLVKIGYTENGKNYPVELSNGQMFVNVPWVNDDTTYTAGTGLTLSGTTFNANVDGTQTTAANTSTTTAGRTYKVQVDSGDNLVVNVPWVDTDTDTTNWNFRADSNTAENISAGETLTFASGTNVSIGQSGNTLTINSTDTDTTYSAGIGLSLTGTTFNANVVNSATTQTPQTITTTANRLYQVETDDQDNLVVNVPWVDTDTDTNNYVTGASVTGTTTKTLTLTRQGLSNITAQWTDIDTNTQRTDEEIRDVAAAQWVNGTNTTVVVSDANDTIKINATNTNDIDYINAASFNTSDGVLTLSGVGNAGATVDLDGRYLTSYTETDTLATVVSRGNSSSGTVNITGNGSFFTIQGNAASTSIPSFNGFAFSWNRQIGQNASEILFKGSTSGHSGRLDITSYDGSSFETYFKIQTTYNGINTSSKNITMPAPGSVIVENNSGEHRFRKSFDGSRWADLVSNSVGGELQLARSNSPYVKLVTLGDSYLNGGDVGIGTTTPGTKLDVNGVITATGGTSTNWNTAYTHSQSAHAPVNAEQNVQANWNETNSGSDAFIQNKPTIPTNYLRDDADDTTSGRITAKAYKFNGNDSNPTTTTATIYDQASVGLTASAHNFSIRNYNGSSMVESARFTTGSLTVIGDVVAYGSPSDITLKENIKPIENALDKVEKLQGVTFDWKESDSILNIKEDIGFIAQDVQKVLPELVRENDNGKLSLRHQGIISVLAEAIKELSDRIKILEDGSTK